MQAHKLLPALFISGLFLVSCKRAQEKDTNQWQDEIRLVEKDFETMAAEKGLAEAFSHFADTAAVIKRGKDSLMYGKQAIRNFYSDEFYKTVLLKWTPDFIEVSRQGDMAYTYGKYTFGFPDSSGKVNESTGVFHTVWKRQPDGSWKYVWD